VPLCRPTAEMWEEATNALVPVRSQPCQIQGKHLPQGYRLLTHQRQIFGGNVEE